MNIFCVILYINLVTLNGYMANLPSDLVWYQYMSTYTAHIKNDLWLTQPPGVDLWKLEAEESGIIVTGDIGWTHYTHFQLYINGNIDRSSNTKTEHNMNNIWDTMVDVFPISWLYQQCLWTTQLRVLVLQQKKWVYVCRRVQWKVLGIKCYLIGKVNGKTKVRFENMIKCIKSVKNCSAQY